MLGGSFDPVHLAHVALARAAIDELSVYELRVMPASEPPHKEAYGATNDQRLSMLELAFADIEKVRIDARELERVGPSYTLLSMRELREELGASTPIYFVMGWDSLASLDTWWCWRELFETVNIAVAGRPGYEGFASTELYSEYQSRYRSIESESAAPAGRIVSLAMSARAISSSEIRACLSGRSSNLREALPADVAAYIKQHGLYC